jgi:hypothetical protein
MEEVFVHAKRRNLNGLIGNWEKTLPSHLECKEPGDKDCGREETRMNQEALGLPQGGSVQVRLTAGCELWAHAKIARVSFAC